MKLEIRISKFEGSTKSERENSQSLAAAGMAYPTAKGWDFDYE
jgi:hypothetical protein